MAYNFYRDDNEQLYHFSDEMKSEYTVEFTYYYDNNPAGVRTKSEPVSAYVMNEAIEKIKKRYPNVKILRVIS